MQVLPITEEAIQQAVRILQSGGTIVYPTETAYALGADPRNRHAVEKVFLIKGRDEGKPMGLVAGPLEQVEELCVLGDKERLLTTRFWPGALSLVLPLRNNLSIPASQRLSPANAYGVAYGERGRAQPLAGWEWLAGLSRTTAQSESISIRVSSHPFVQKLCKAFGFPIIATSANKSGVGEVFDAKTFLIMFKRFLEPDLLLDGGLLPPSPMSTVVKMVDEKIHILRNGAVQIPGNLLE